MADPKLPEPGETWWHFKGQKYRVIAIALHSETQEKMVIYKADDEPETWARPIGMWMEPATVKPTKPGEYNCYHTMQSHYLNNLPGGEQEMYCEDCIDHAKLGRFVLVEDD